MRTLSAKANTLPGPTVMQPMSIAGKHKKGSHMSASWLGNSMVGLSCNAAVIGIFG